MSEDWQAAMKSLPEGIVIVSNSKEISILFHNSAMPAIITKCKPSNDPNTITQNYYIHDEIQTTLNNMTLKQSDISAKEGDIQIHLKNLLINPEGTQGNTYFLDNCDTLIQLRIHIIWFQNQEARLLSFSDCSAAQKIEQAESESKYKTLLISTVSHEIRTPIGAVLGTIDLIKPFVPPEKLNLLEIARLSCEMIIFHINDLTVKH